MIGTERNAPATPHIMYQKTSAKSTTTGCSRSRFPKMVGSTKFYPPQKQQPKKQTKTKTKTTKDNNTR